MKRILSFLLALSLLAALTACAGTPASDRAAADAAATPAKPADTAPEADAQPTSPAAEAAADPQQPESPETDATSAPDAAEAEPAQTQDPAPEAASAAGEPDAQPDGSSILVVYFSATGNTKAVAEQIAALTGAELYEIVPAEPYTAEDLDYNSDCRANREMNDPAARPAISGDVPDVSGYDTVLLGYPLWWGTMPRILQTFLDACDLSGKVVLPFCTSGSSGISQSVADLRSAAPEADVQDGLRAKDAQDSGIEAWLRENGVLA